MSNSVAFIDRQSFESKPWSPDRESCQTITLTVLSHHRSTLLCQWNGRCNGSIRAWKKAWIGSQLPPRRSAAKERAARGSAEGPDAARFLHLTKTRTDGSRQISVGVGITITHDPLHGSGRAGFPHPALALGNNAHAAQRIGMTDSRQKQPASDEAPHAIPENAAVLAPPRQRAMPIPADSESKHRQRRLVHGHSVVAKVSTYNRPQPLALLGDGLVHASPKLGFHLVQLRLQPFANRLPQHRKPSIAPLLHADMRKAKKVERLRLPFSGPLPLVDRIRTELEKSRFLGMQ